MPQMPTRPDQIIVAVKYVIGEDTQPHLVLCLTPEALQKLLTTKRSESIDMRDAKLSLTLTVCAANSPVEAKQLIDMILHPTTESKPS